MTAVCLIVLSIIGAYCYDGAEPVGDCYTIPMGQLCFVEAEQLPIRASWYNPALGGINCLAPCDLLGDGTAVSGAYGWAAACPAGWYGRWIEVEAAGRWQCRDSGGAIVPHWGEVFIPGQGTAGRWYITIDFLLQQEPGWAYLLLDWAPAD